MLFLAFRNLFRNKRRTSAILLTIALGSGALFSFEGFICGVLNQYRDNTIHSHYGNGQINVKGYRETVYQDPWNHWIKNGPELEQFLQGLSDVEYIFPRVSFSALLSNGRVTVSGQGQGIQADKESKFFYGLEVVEGETLMYQPDGILLGKGLAKALDVQPGSTLTLLANAADGTLNSTELKVAGIFNTGSLDFDSRIFRIQLKEAQKLLKTSNIEHVSLGLYSLNAWDGVAAAIQEKFPELEATSFVILDKVYYQHSVDWLNAQFHVVQIIILSILLLGIFNTVSASILERKQEIGNLRANGESVFGIMKLIVVEGAFLGFLGSIFGLILSFSIMKLFLENGIEMPPGPGLTNHFYVTFSFQWMMVRDSILLSTGAAIIASFLAGMRVSKMPIAKALRSY